MTTMTAGRNSIWLMIVQGGSFWKTKLRDCVNNIKPGMGDVMHWGVTFLGSPVYWCKVAFYYLRIAWKRAGMR